MLLWIVCAAMALLAAALIARPLMAGSGARRAVSASSIYRDQLKELEREVARGDMAAAQAEDARREIARRLLAADTVERRSATGGWKSDGRVGMALAIIVPVGAIGLYAALGSPGLPGQPLAERDMNAAMQQAPLDEIAEQLFQKLAMDPGHADGWVLLGRTYLRLERFDEAASAFERAIALLGAGAPADLFSSWGEALTLAAGRRVTPEAAAAFEEAVKRDPRDAPARYYLAIQKAQAGDTAGAIAGLEALLADTPEDAAQRALIQARIAELSGAGEAPRDNEAIQGMVASLAAKLEAEPQNLDGWLLLLTSYVRLEEPEKAKAALATARETFKDDPAALEALAAKAKELGIEG
jgi:cytochrome c-type biogenesis protein CcmH